jgi:hypothetical protein
MEEGIMGKKLLRYASELNGLIDDIEKDNYCVWDRFRGGPDFYPCVAVWTIAHSSDRERRSLKPLIEMEFVYLDDFGVERSD